MRNHELIEQLQPFNQMAEVTVNYQGRVLVIKSIKTSGRLGNPQLSLTNVIEVDDPDARYEAEQSAILRNPKMVTVTTPGCTMPREVFDRLVEDANTRDAIEAQRKAAEAARVAVPNGVAALHFFLMVELKRCYHNRMRAEWDTTTDPGIEGITWRSKPSMWSHRSIQPPRFEFEDVQLWFDEPGRATKANKALTNDEWVAWFDRCHAHIIKWGDSPRPRTDDDDSDIDFDGWNG